MRSKLAFLLVEDDDIHAHLVTRSLEKMSLNVVVHRVENGADALAFLRQVGRFANSPRPDVVLMDLKLPKIDGLQVLAEIKADEILRVIPVVVLTTSRDEGDRQKAYQRHANSYIVKPADYEQFRHVVAEISHYWGVHNEPPCLANGWNP